MTTPWFWGATKFSMVRCSMVTWVASETKEKSFRPWPFRMAPGAPMKVSPSWGSIWLYTPEPKVYAPGANQKVVPGP